MSEEDQKSFFERIDKLTLNNKAKFGKMNVHHVLPHCADQIRMALGTKKSLEYGKVDPKKILSLVKTGKPVPTPKGFGQVEGHGTPPTTLEGDKIILKEYIIKFSQLENSFKFHPNTYFGDIPREKWTSLIKYHLNHHLDQFGV
ncbi:MAG: hypothetical protein RLO81_02965 [Fulvivirga sp.]|uniref:hypothetical protein n=1 Tax=Fulvivirga sp. TaxID=1931237 RepID=UPI0032EDB888